MKLEEIIALKSQIFAQIVEGDIPKEAIEELFGGSPRYCPGPRHRVYRFQISGMGG